MKTFKDYLMESAREYKYRVKIAGECTDEFFRKFEEALSKFSIMGFTEPKKSPIMPHLPGFPDTITNSEMYVVDVTLHYPANEEQIRQIAVKSGARADRVVVVTSMHDDSNIKCAEEKAKDAVNGSLLNSPYPETSKEQKQASDDYASGNQTAAQNSVSIEHKFAAPTAPKAMTTNDIPMGTKSPMTKVNLPPLPKTGKDA